MRVMVQTGGEEQIKKGLQEEEKKEGSQASKQAALSQGMGRLGRTEFRK